MMNRPVSLLRDLTPHNPRRRLLALIVAVASNPWSGLLPGQDLRGASDAEHHLALLGKGYRIRGELVQTDYSAGFPEVAVFDSLEVGKLDVLAGEYARSEQFPTHAGLGFGELHVLDSASQFAGFWQCHPVRGIQRSASVGEPVRLKFIQKSSFTSRLLYFPGGVPIRETFAPEWSATNLAWPETLRAASSLPDDVQASAHRIGYRSGTRVLYVEYALSGNLAGSWRAYYLRDNGDPLEFESFSVEWLADGGKGDHPARMEWRNGSPSEKLTESVLTTKEFQFEESSDVLATAWCLGPAAPITDRSNGRSLIGAILDGRLIWREPETGVDRADVITVALLSCGLLLVVASGVLLVLRRRRGAAR